MTAENYSLLINYLISSDIPVPLFGSTVGYQYHCTALLIPLRLSYFKASVSVEALHLKVKL